MHLNAFVIEFLLNSYVMGSIPNGVNDFKICIHSFPA